MPDLLVALPVFCSVDWLKQECSRKKVFVLPAFETAPNANMTVAHAIASEAAARDKQGLLSMVEAGKVWQFALRIFKEVTLHSRFMCLCC